MPVTSMIRLRTVIGWLSRSTASFTNTTDLSNGKPTVQHRASKIRIIAMTFSERNRQALEQIGESHSWEVLFANRWIDILAVAHGYNTGVVILDRDVLGSDWKEAVWSLCQPAQRCLVILIDPRIPDCFSDAFKEVGGYGVLKTPLQEMEVVATVRSAWAVWNHCFAPAHWP